MDGDRDTAVEEAEFLSKNYESRTTGMVMMIIMGNDSAPSNSLTLSCLPYCLCSWLDQIGGKVNNN